MAMAPTTAAAMGSVPVDKAGVGSAVINSMRQVGGSLGTAVLNTVAVSAAAGYAGTRAAAFVHGLSVATALGVGILVVAALVAAVLISAGRPQPHRAA